jgi:hypothetical protein
LKLDASVLPSLSARLGATGSELTGCSAQPILAGDGQGRASFASPDARESPTRHARGRPFLRVLPAASGSASAWSHPAREALVYETGLLERCRREDLFEFIGGKISRKDSFWKIVD